MAKIEFDDSEPPLSKEEEAKLDIEHEQRRKSRPMHDLMHPCVPQ